jgi:hypothetical protein
MEPNETNATVGQTDQLDQRNDETIECDTNQETFAHNDTVSVSETEVEKEIGCKDEKNICDVETTSSPTSPTNGRYL